MARAIDAPLAAHGRRPLKIGALFGATPTRASRQELIEREWLRRGQDFICPWMRCPICDAELLWRQADLEAGTERLACTRTIVRVLLARSDRPYPWALTAPATRYPFHDDRDSEPTSLGSLDARAIRRGIT